MKFRVLFSALALLALASFALAQPCDLLVNYYQWPCPEDLPMTSGGCWTGTPFPDGPAVNVYKASDNSLIGMATIVNGTFYSIPGFFVDEASLVIQSDVWPMNVYAQVTYNYCTYTSVTYSISAGPRTIETCQAEWTCVCETPQYNDDLGDLGVTPIPPNPSAICPNVGPAGVPYPTGPHPAGPCHHVPSSAWLGAAINAEAVPNIQDLDPFDDGVVFVGPFPWNACTMQSVIVTVSGAFTSPVFLSGWKDGNVDGDFADVLCLYDGNPNNDSPEWIIQDFPIPAPGPYTFTFNDPGCETGQTFPYTGVFRFRLSHAPMGPAWWMGGHDEIGEVEDYYIEGLQLPVELTAAPTVAAGDRELTLSFNVSDETNVNTYEIWRDGVKVTDITKASGSYSYADRNLVNNRLYNYTIVAVGLNDRKELSFNGKTIWSGSPSYLNATVTEYALHQNYPNPFNPSTEIVYDVLQTGVVTLKVFNVMGQEVATLVNGTVEAGRHAATFNATGLTSGLYFYTITMGDQFSATKKMLLVQ